MHALLPCLWAALSLRAHIQPCSPCLPAETHQLPGWKPELKNPPTTPPAHSSAQETSALGANLWPLPSPQHAHEVRRHQRRPQDPRPESPSPDVPRGKGPGLWNGPCCPLQHQVPQPSLLVQEPTSCWLSSCRLKARKKQTSPQSHSSS